MEVTKFDGGGLLLTIFLCWSVFVIGLFVTIASCKRYKKCGNDCEMKSRYYEMKSKYDANCERVKTLIK